MATVHPSRMGLIPQERKEHPPRGRSPSPRRRQSPRRDDRDDRTRERRRSPQYDAYKRQSPPHLSDAQAGDAPWRQRENMYPNRGNRQPLPVNAGGFAGGGNDHNGGGYGGGGHDYLDGRRQQRDASTLNIWPPSPKPPRKGSLSPGREHKHRKKSKRDRSESPSDTDSEEERRRIRKKEKKRARKEKDEEKRERKKHRSRSPRRSYDSDDDRRERRRPRSYHSKTRSPSPKRSRPRSPTPDDDDQWVEKPAQQPVVPAPALSPASASMPPPPLPPPDSDSDDEVGPQPLHKPSGKQRIDERQYGGALLRGEGSAMAAFLQLEDGTDARIPRRGEIGLTSDEIERYEDVGYVMSGSRHRRMNAVRIRKENQVISAEEKRGILKLQKEERERREAILREEFQSLVEDRLSGAEKK